MRMSLQVYALYKYAKLRFACRHSIKCIHREKDWVSQWVRASRSDRDGTIYNINSAMIRIMCVCVLQKKSASYNNFISMNIEIACTIITIIIVWSRIMFRFSYWIRFDEFMAAYYDGRWAIYHPIHSFSQCDIVMELSQAWFMPSSNLVKKTKLTSIRGQSLRDHIRVICLGNFPDTFAHENNRNWLN